MFSIVEYQDKAIILKFCFKRILIFVNPQKNFLILEILCIENSKNTEKYFINLSKITCNNFSEERKGIIGIIGVATQVSLFPFLI